LGPSRGAEERGRVGGGADFAPDPPNGFVDTADIARITGLFGERCPGS